MQTRVSTKGQVVLPGPTRRKLGIRAGDVLDVSVEDESGRGRIVLTVTRQPHYELEIVTDPITGLPVLTAGTNAPTMTSKEVEEILAEFP